MKKRDPDGKTAKDDGDDASKKYPHCGSAKRKKLANQGKATKLGTHVFWNKIKKIPIIFSYLLFYFYFL